MTDLDTLVDRVANGSSTVSWGRATYAGLTLGILGNLAAGPVVANDITSLLQYTGDPVLAEHYRAMLAATRESFLQARGISFLTVCPLTLFGALALNAYRRVRNYFAPESPAERIFRNRNYLLLIHSQDLLQTAVDQFRERRNAFFGEKPLGQHDLPQIVSHCRQSVYNGFANIVSHIIAKAKGYSSQRVRKALDNYIVEKRTELKSACRDGGLHESGHHISFLGTVMRYVVHGDKVSLDDRRSVSSLFPIRILAGFSAFVTGNGIYERTSSFTLAATATLASYLAMRTLAVYVYSSTREKFSGTLTKVKEHQRTEYQRFERLLERVS